VSGNKITTGGIVVETIADEQLRGFMLKRPQTREIITKGLWAYSRHPNHFVEVMFWLGLFLFALVADSSYWWTIIGPVSITILFIIISIPLMEKRGLEGRRGYESLERKFQHFSLGFQRCDKSGYVFGFPAKTSGRDCWSECPYMRASNLKVRLI
jgi:steroid 5-alpha reductase family enzyme